VVGRLIEGVLAISLVLIAQVALQAYVPHFSVAAPELKSVAANALLSLDDSGLLPNLVLLGADTGNWTALSKALLGSLPAGVSYRLQIFDMTTGSGSQLAGTPLTWGVLQGQTATATYTLSAFDANQQPPTTRIFQLTLTVATLS
jgi:hypothetical protein